MKCVKFLVILGLTAVLSVSSASGQVCGNVNGDPGGSVDISDMVYLLNWLYDGPAPPNPSMADMDGRSGLTIADVTYFQQYLFGNPSGPAPDCSGGGTYSYAVAESDSIFLPRLLGIPESIESLVIPIVTVLQANTVGYYIPAIKAAESNGIFRFDSVSTQSGGSATEIYMGRKIWGDTLILVASGTYSSDVISGVRSYYGAHFTRVAPGLGDISFEATDRGDGDSRRFAVVKDDGDLYIPVVSHLDDAPEFLQAPTEELAFSAVRLFPSNDSYDLDITATMGTIDWEAETDADWLTLSSWTGTTPATLTVSVGEIDLPAGNYVGTINLHNVSGGYEYDQGIEIPVRLSLISPHPSMDANCDGLLNISDLTYLVNYLYGIPLGPAPCDPCTGLFPDE
jgi:hypothetical protein